MSDKGSISLDASIQVALHELRRVWLTRRSQRAAEVLAHSIRGIAAQFKRCLSVS